MTALGHIGLVLKGVDGSMWDLRNGTVRAGRGISGLGRIPTKANTRETTQTDGQRLLGIRSLARRIELPLFINHSQPDDHWFATNRAFWAAVDEEEYCTLYVLDPIGGVRHIALRLEDDNDYEFDYDPSDIGLTEVRARFVADDGWFRGNTITVPIDPPAEIVDFFGPTGYGPPFYISNRGASDAQIVSNPGDVSAWPIWMLNGPMASFDLTVDGNRISGTFPIDEGATLTIDTRPNRKTAILRASDGSEQDVFRLLDDIEFGEIPRGERVPITVETIGAGNTTLSFDPLYKMGF